MHRNALFGCSDELHEGVLTLEGARYAWRVSMFTDLDGGRFVADLGEFKPMDWAAMVRLVQ